MVSVCTCVFGGGGGVCGVCVCVCVQVCVVTRLLPIIQSFVVSKIPIIL